MREPRSPLPAQIENTFRWGFAATLLSFFACLGLALSSCAAITGAPSVQAQRGVYQAESDFAAVLPVVVAYEALPACSASQPFPCSDPAVVAKLTAAAKAARASLATAEAAVRSGSNGSAVVAAALKAEGDVEAFAALAATLGR